MPAQDQQNCPIVKNAERVGKAVNRASYRAVMGHKADTVCIVAAGVPGSRGGLTATSVCSLSDDPPTILVCINHAASVHDLIATTGSFSVNILTNYQSKLADIFSGRTGIKGNDRFADTDWHQTDTGGPVLKNALATLECTLSDCHDFSTHSIFLGHVIKVSARSNTLPLLYQRGQYRELD